MTQSDNIIQFVYFVYQPLAPDRLFCQLSTVCNPVKCRNLGETVLNKFSSKYMLCTYYDITKLSPPILLIFHISLQVLFHQFKYFLNLYFLLVALSQFVPALRIGYLYTYWGPLVSWRFFVSVCVCQSVSVTVSVMCSRVRLVLFGVCVSQSVSQSVKCRIYQRKLLWICWTL